MRLPYKAAAGSIAALSIFAASTAAFAQNGSTSSIPGAGFSNERAAHRAEVAAQLGLTEAELQAMPREEVRALADAKGIDLPKRGGDRKGPPEEVLSLLGMTKDELKAEVDARIAADATLNPMDAVKAIAEAKGITLPVPQHVLDHLAELSAKLGMTEAELKAELEAGKSPHDIAEAKGIDLPAPPMMGGKGRGGPDKLLEKLGMTKEEFKAEIDAGKTPEEIAEAKGIELPERGEGHGMRRDGPPEEVLSALGMTAGELKAEVEARIAADDSQNPRDVVKAIADEKGIELPAPPMGGGRGGPGGGHGGPGGGMMFRGGFDGPENQ